MYRQPYLHVVGVARAIKYYREQANEPAAETGIAIASTGDSATSEGYVFEAINGAANEQLPVLFVIQNNHYGISVPLSSSTANHERISENFRGIKNLYIEQVDGTDAESCFHGVNRCLEYIRSGKGSVDRRRCIAFMRLNWIATRCIEPMKRSKVWPSRSLTKPRLRSALRVAERTIKALEAEVEEEQKTPRTRGGGGDARPRDRLDFVTPTGLASGF